LLGWLLWPFISVIVLAIVITGVFNPVYRAFHRKLNATLSSLITCVIIFFVLFVPVSAFVGILANEAYDLYLTARDAVVSNPINELLENSKIIEKINNILINFGVKITGDELISG
jgi:predicted PurR-regulated permease PerM